MAVKKILLFSLFALAFIAALLEIWLAHPGAHHFPGFQALAAIIACLALIILAKIIAKPILGRKEDYWQ